MAESKKSTIPVNRTAGLALYHPVRDAVPWVPSVTETLMGDPPPGRRELLERHDPPRRPSI